MSKPGSDTGLFVFSESPADTTNLIRKRASRRPTSQMPPEELAAFLVEFQRQRWKLGVKLLVEDLLRDHASLRDAPQLSTLIYNEFLLRTEYGETPSVEEYQSRFPLHAHRLERQLKQNQATADPCPMSPEERSGSSGDCDPAETVEGDEPIQARRHAVVFLAILAIILIAGAAAGTTMVYLRAEAVQKHAEAAAEQDLETPSLGTAALSAFSANGKVLASTSRTDRHVVRVLDLTSGKIVRQLTHQADVLQVALSRDGSVLVTASQDFKDGQSQRVVCVWDVASGKCKSSIACPRNISKHLYGGVALSPDGRLLAYDENAASSEVPPESHARAAVRILDLATGQTVRLLDNLPALVCNLEFSPDGRFLAITCEQSGVLVYDRQTDCWPPLSL